MDAAAPPCGDGASGLRGFVLVCATADLGVVAFSGLPGTLGLALDLDDLSLASEADYEGDDRGGIGKDLIPLAEGFVVGDDGREALVAPGEHIEEQVSGASVAAEVVALIT